MTTPPADDFICEAYGPDVARLGARCFFAGADERVCATRAICEQSMAAERQRVFRKMNELAASGDPEWAAIEAEFSHPEQLLGGGEQSREKGDQDRPTD